MRHVTRGFTKVLRKEVCRSITPDSVLLHLSLS
jgi:hypothetical protein